MFYVGIHVLKVSRFALHGVELQFRMNLLHQLDGVLLSCGLHHQHNLAQTNGESNKHIIILLLPRKASTHHRHRAII